VSLLCFAVSQMEEIVQKFGMVVISRAGSNPEKFIYESDILTKHKVFCLLFNLYYNYKKSYSYMFDIIVWRMEMVYVSLVRRNLVSIFSLFNLRA